MCMMLIPGITLYVYGVKYDSPIQYVGIIICGSAISMVILYAVVVIINYIVDKCRNKIDVLE